MKGICFIEPLFKAVVNGTKTQTRRIVKPQPYHRDENGKSYACFRKHSSGYKIPYFQQPKSSSIGHLINTSNLDSYKNKDLLLIPFMLASALRAKGWYLRQDIIWHKPNPMPESIKDRCVKSHEYIFLMSKSAHYYFDYKAILTPVSAGTHNNNFANFSDGQPAAMKRSVWSVLTKPEREKHFACFPEKLISDCILAGCPENGVVLDPFFGSGTTGTVARKLGRNYIGIELNPEYVKIAERKLRRELGMFELKLS